MALRQLDKTYDPQHVEGRWYRFWEERHYFDGSPNHPGTPYTIVIPPPNITGSLHVGHALNNSLQDILIRWRRMQGRNALWVPGTDHAGIATQNVVERQLTAEEGQTREALGRQKFIERVWAWKARYGETIIQQLKRLGASCDWERLRFTMDEGLSRAVREVFVRLYEEGLIYRGERLINWCPRCLTALSDIEVEHEDTKGKLYHITYPVADDSGRSLTVATTRPETMLGDTAVAVHPEDTRYTDLVGRRVKLPLTHRTIPILADPILVNREFGTGVVKITPAHDFNDFEAGERHRLPRLPILDPHAKLDPRGLRAAEVEEAVITEVERLPVSKARPKIEQLLQDRGFLVKVEPHPMALGRCYRCKTVVEPYLSPQWFVKIRPLAEPAIAAVEDGRIRLIPEGWMNNYMGWMREIKDWCISRQIWWGHQIPAWYCRSCCGDRLLAPAQHASWAIPADAEPIVSRTQPTHCPSCGGTEFIRDPDVLDTWFSSALWPFSTLGWPEETPDLRTFYPTSTLVTGLDILFFWVARMIMMGLKFTGQVPFRDVYIHALVRDAEGQKMSKSKGNVIDPLQVMEQYGTDALRFTLASMASPGRDIKLAEERIEGYRNFANKIWNAARFILMHLDGPREAGPAKARSFADRWILSRLNQTIRDVTTALELYRFDQAAGRLYQFIWHEYCDWYLEMVKPALQDSDSSEARPVRQTLLESFETVQRLLHPFMPFITEEVWQSLPHDGDSVRDSRSRSVMVQRYPTPIDEWDDKKAEDEFLILERFITTARDGRVKLGYPPGKRISLFGTSTRAEELQTLERLKPYLEEFGRGDITLAPLERWPAGKVLGLVVGTLTVGMLVEGDVDINKVLEKVRKQRREAEIELSRVQGKLDNPEFLAKAPEAVRKELGNRRVELSQESRLLASSQEQLESMSR
jgi:valyl-tRNA synthetase